ncbi:MAG: glycosyltransferase family 4 protein [Desulfobacteraceae bacterium]|nr:glycosyltransferase family 4 protein [Desulfobacteraceae bacterium]
MRKDDRGARNGLKSVPDISALSKKQKRINVLMDISMIRHGADKSISRTGLYFVAYNILLVMLKRKDLNLKFYCNPGQKHFVDVVLKSNKKLKGLSIINYSRVDGLIAYFEHLKYESKLKKGPRLIREAIRMILDLFKWVSNAKIYLNMNRYYKDLLKDTDLYFSPWGRIPPEINKIEAIKKYSLIHDMIPLIFQEFASKKSEDYQYYHSLDKKSYYFANSEHTKRDFIKFTGIPTENVRTIMLSTSLECKRINDRLQIEKVKEKNNIPRDKKYLFSLCTLNPRKNLIFAIHNFVEFVKRHNIDDFIFVLGGAYSEKHINEIDFAINQLDGFRDKIIKIGYVDDEDLTALYCGAEMFVYPSIYEGFGMPILEAMKCGCPVICSNTSSMPEVIGDCGIQIDPTSDEEFINALEKMAFDDRFRGKCIEKGLERAKQFSWEYCVDDIVEEFRESLDG